MKKTKFKRSQIAFKNALCTILESKSLDKIFVKEILDLSGYSNMAFYDNYSDKYDLAKKIIEDEATFHAQTLYQIVSLESHLESIDQLKLFEKTSNSFFKHVQKNKKIYYCIFNNKLMDNSITYFSHYTSIVLKNYFDFYQQEDNIITTYYDFFIEQSISMILFAAKY
ncbi:MAG: TetR/AcrR family transcriptional regulator [Traorella sp.]